MMSVSRALFVVFVLLAAGIAFAGTIMEAVSPCGYRSGALFLGAGKEEPPPAVRDDESAAPSAPAKVTMPALCAQCRRVVEAEIADGKKKPACPACRSTVTPYTERSLRNGKAEPFTLDGVKYVPAEFRWRKVTLPACRYTCPREGEKHMIFTARGTWD